MLWQYDGALYLQHSYYCTPLVFDASFSDQQQALSKGIQWQGVAVTRLSTELDSFSDEHFGSAASVTS